MQPPDRILIFQTAFLGDVVLTLPLVQVLHREFPNTQIDFLTTPKAAAILRNHPAIHAVIEYDKRGAQRGFGGMFSISRILKAQRYDIALVPHRSLRSAVVTALSRIRCSESVLMRAPEDYFLQKRFSIEKIFMRLNAIFVF